MNEFRTELTNFVVDEAAYDKFKSIIEAAKALKKVEVFRKPTLASGFLEKGVRESLQAADESFECQEWYSAMDIYDEFHESKLGPKSVASKLSLCLVLSFDFLSALPLAIQAIVDTPLDSNAYIALAIIKSRARCGLESERLLQLAELTSNPNTTIIAMTRRENTIYADMRKNEIASFQHLMKFNPDFIESFKASDIYQQVEDRDSVIDSMARVKENPDCLEEEMTSNLEFAEVVLHNGCLPEICFPRHFDDQSSRQFAQADCPFHSVNSSALLGIVKYISYYDLVALRSTCRYLEYIGGFPENFKLIVTRMGIGCPPAQQWTTKRHEQYLHEATIAINWIYRFFEFFPIVSGVDFEKETHRQFYCDKMRRFNLQQRRFTNENESASPKLFWELISQQCLNWSENGFAKHVSLRSDIWLCLENAFCITTPTYFEDYPTAVELFINLVVLGKLRSFPTSIMNRFWSLLEHSLSHVTSAALAVCCNAPRLSEMNLVSVCETVEVLKSRLPVHRSRYFFLDGIWQGVQSYASGTLKDIREECIMNLKFPSIVVGQVMVTEPTPFEMIGTGVDSFGEFELEDPIIDNWDLTITFTKVYRRTNEYHKPIKHYYRGILNPSGIGGCFGPLYGAGGGFRIDGFFFYGRPLACADAASGYSPSFPTTTHTATMSWGDLIPSISKRAEENAQVKSLLFQQFDKADTKIPFYELAMYDEANELVQKLMNATRDYFLARLPSTTLSEIRAYLEEHQSIGPGNKNTLPERYLADSDTKWHLRCQMMQITSDVFSSAQVYLLLHDSDLLEPIGKILKQFNFDRNKPEVQSALHQFQVISRSASPSHRMDAKKIGAARRIDGNNGYLTSRQGTNILISAAVAASALVLVGALIVGRMFMKQKSQN